MGLAEDEGIVNDHQIAILVTGFEPADLLQRILMTLNQLENGTAQLKNPYSRVVPFDGNPAARQILDQVFEVSDREWRGIGTIPRSGWHIKPKLAAFDAERKSDLATKKLPDTLECISGQIPTGIKKPGTVRTSVKNARLLIPWELLWYHQKGACATYFNLC